MSQPVTEDDIPVLMAAGMLQLEKGDASPDPSPLISSLSPLFKDNKTQRAYRINAKLFGYSFTVRADYVGPHSDVGSRNRFNPNDEDRSFPRGPAVRREHENCARRALARDINKTLPTLPRHLQMALYAALQDPANIEDTPSEA